jgi:hypothetical protein
MRLYSGSSTGFVGDTVHNRVTEMLREAFRYAYHRDPAAPEVNSWRDSLRAISGVFETAGLTDNGVILEYELPLFSCRSSGRGLESELAPSTIEESLSTPMWVPEIMAFFFQIFWRHHFVPQTPCQVGDDESGMMARQPQSAVPSPALDQLLPPPNHDHVVPLPSW